MEMKNKVFFVLSFALLMGLFAGMANAGLAVSLVNQDPDPAIAAGTFDANVAVQNVGDDSASNLTISFVPSYPFQLVAGEASIRQVPAMSSYQGLYGVNQQVLKYTLLVDPSATAGTYDLKLDYFYDGDSTRVFHQALPINVKNRESAEVIRIDKYALSPGQADWLNFTISNVGDAPLRDLTFSWNTSSGVILPIGSSNSRYLKSLEVGESVNVSYQVMAATGATTGLYVLNLHLNYNDAISGTAKEDDTVTGVYVGGTTDFDVSFSDSLSGVTSFTIANVGRNSASSVLVSIPDQRGWRVSGASSAIVGNLNQGDYTIAGFKITSSSGIAFGNASSDQAGSGQFTPPVAGSGMPSAAMAGNRGYGNSSFSGARGSGSANSSVPQTILLQIAYTDTLGDRQVIQKQVQLSSSSLAGADAATALRNGAGARGDFLSMYWMYLVVVAVIVVAALVYLRHRKKAKASAKSKAAAAENKPISFKGRN